MPTYGPSYARTFTPSRTPKKPVVKNTGLDLFDRFLINAALIGIIGLIALPLLAPKRKKSP